MSRPAILVCVTVDGTDPSRIAAGSRVDRCGGCKARVWRAPSADGLPYEPRCYGCAAGMITSAGAVEVISTTAAQLAEVAAWQARRRS